MESSPLILAQTHARQAVAVSSVDPIAAVGEHDRAAGQYATAAKDTSNSEAFRTLKLLESYHERLSQLLKFDPAQPVQQVSGSPSEEKADLQANPSKPPSKPQEESPYRSQQSHHPPPPPPPPPPRDISSSIASNLASARGIPTNRQRRGSPASPASSTQHAEGKLTTPTRRPKPSDRPSRAASNPIQEKVQSSLRQPTPPTKPKTLPPTPLPPTTDEPFHRFYSTFAPLISALSAPLAFAGLPLNPSPDPPSSPLSPNPSSHKTPPKPPPTPSLSDNPDYTRAFSRAALRALNPTSASPFPAHESFYVVPTTGHTTSYAEILARTKREAAKTLPDHLSASQTLADESEFVDARETPQPPSPTTSRTARGGMAGGGKTMEELTLENGAMRDLMDVLSKRLAQFEMGSQSQSQALWQSFRVPKGDGPPVPGMGNEEAEKVAALEARLQGQREDLEKMAGENEKLRGLVTRYRERWEKLKEGARSKRAGTEA